MALKLIDITKKFGKKTIFYNYSYHFADTGVYFLSGNSGIGKTTLLRIISGLDKDYYGKVIGGGIGAVSFAFQEHRLFPSLSALDNVLEASFDEINKESIYSAKDILTYLGFTESDMKLKPSALSGGMKQRVSLARAFLRDSKILLLDEPTKELDGELCDRVLNLIRTNGERRLVICVSHNIGEAYRLGARIIELKETPEPKQTVISCIKLQIKSGKEPEYNIYCI